MISDNTEDINGTDVYTNRITRLCDKYISSLADTEEECRELIRNKQCFKGMLKYIYINLLKKKDSREHCNIDYSNIECINNLWEIYTTLCYKYNQLPYTLGFFIMTGISNMTINEWEKGRRRGNINISTRKGGEGGRAAISHREAVKNWKEETEANLWDSAAGGNPGAMFLLKASFGYSEGAQQLQITTDAGQRQSAEEIAARHTAGLLDAAEDPEAPPEL